MSKARPAVLAVDVVHGPELDADDRADLERIRDAVDPGWMHTVGEDDRVSHYVDVTRMTDSQGGTMLQTLQIVANRRCWKAQLRMVGAFASSVEVAMVVR